MKPKIKDVPLEGYVTKFGETRYHSSLGFFDAEEKIPTQLFFLTIEDQKTSRIENIGIRKGNQREYILEKLLEAYNAGDRLHFEGIVREFYKKYPFLGEVLVESLYEGTLTLEERNKKFRLKISQNKYLTSAFDIEKVVNK